MLRKYHQTTLKLILTILSIFTPLSVLAQETMDQVTSVNQLRDVSPRDWAYQAITNLNENYHCLEGYPDRTFRGDRPLTRYEFAAALSACFEHIQNLGTDNSSVTSDDLQTLDRLRSEFRPEIDNLTQRVNDLETTVDTLENDQFSTTTKLEGEAIFALTSDSQGEATFSDRIRLNLNTQITGDDRLRVRLQAGNNPDLSTVTGTDMSRVSFYSNNQNDIGLDEAYYCFTYKDKMCKTFSVGAVGLDIDDILKVGNPQLNSSATGSLSRFNRYNPLVFRGNEGTGLGMRTELGDHASIIAFYLANPSQSSNPNQGIFNSNFTGGVQLNYNLMNNLDLSFTYKHDYFTQGTVNLTSSTGSAIGKDPFNGQTSATQDAFGLNADWQPNNTWQFGGWLGYAQADAQNIDSSVELWNWQVHTSLLNLGKDGANLSLAGGMPPRAGCVNGVCASDQDTSYLIEAQYKYPLNDNITFTPGMYVILNPEHNSNNDPVYVGVFRTTLKF